MPSQILRLARRYLFSPTQGAEAARQEENFIPSLWLYILFTAGYMFFYWIKPFDFPDKNAAFPRETLDLFFWFKAIMLWQPPLEAAWIVFLMGLIMWFREGSMPVRLAAGVAWTAAPFILMVAFGNSLSYSGFALGSAAWLGLFYPLLRKAPEGDWKPLAAFMLGVNVIGFVLLIPMGIAVLIDKPALFNGVQIGGGLWILGSVTLGLRALTGLRLPRAFMAVLLSMFFQIAIAFTLHLLGLVPKEILKALLYA